MWHFIDGLIAGLWVFIILTIISLVFALGRWIKRKIDGPYSKG